VDFAEEEVDDDGEDPEEEIVYDVIVCLLAFVGHGGRVCCSCRALSCVCLACNVRAMVEVEVEGCGPEASRVLCCCGRRILGARCMYVLRGRFERQSEEQPDRRRVVGK